MPNNCHPPPYRFLLPTELFKGIRIEFWRRAATDLRRCFHIFPWNCVPPENRGEVLIRGPSPPQIYNLDSNRLSRINSSLSYFLWLLSLNYLNSLNGDFSFYVANSFEEMWKMEKRIFRVLEFSLVFTVLLLATLNFVSRTFTGDILRFFLMPPRWNKLLTNHKNYS